MFMQRKGIRHFYCFHSNPSYFVSHFDFPLAIGKRRRKRAETILWKTNRSSSCFEKESFRACTLFHIRCPRRGFGPRGSRARSRQRLRRCARRVASNGRGVFAVDVAAVARFRLETLDSSQCEPHCLFEFGVYGYESSLRLER